MSALRAPVGIAADASGPSNKQIASELRLSARSVESQLQRVYEKLGVEPAR